MALETDDDVYILTCVLNSKISKIVKVMLDFYLMRLRKIGKDK